MEAKRALLEAIRLNSVEYLRSRPDVIDVKIFDKFACTVAQIEKWESDRMCMLPDDLKDFYMTCNGFEVRWCALLPDGKYPVGRMHIHSISNLQSVPCILPPSTSASSTSLLLDSSTASSQAAVAAGGGVGGEDRPPELATISTGADLFPVEELSPDSNLVEPDSTSSASSPSATARAFELDTCDGDGRACLVYRDVKPGVPATACEICYVDAALHWSRLCPDFAAYFRLMLVHLGLPRWQRLAAGLCLPPHLTCWYQHFVPERYAIDRGLLSVEAVIDHVPLPHAAGSSTSSSRRLNLAAVLKACGGSSGAVGGANPSTSGESRGKSGGGSSRSGSSSTKPTSTAGGGGPGLSSGGGGSSGAGGAGGGGTYSRSSAGGSAGTGVAASTA